MSRLSRDLLAQAGVLARREPRKPKDASLRRAVSTAYYALFHFLIEEATRLTVGTSHNRIAFRQFTARAFAHTRMKSVCEEFTKGAPKTILKPFWPQLQVSTCLELRTICENFVDLQEQRHAADYDLSRRFTRQEAATAIDQASEAMEAWESLKRSNDELCLFFSLCLMLWPGLEGRK